LLIIDKAAMPYFNAFEDVIEKKIQEESLGMAEGYWGNLPNFLVRISALHRIGRMTKQEIDIFDSTIQPFLIIETEDISYGEQFCWKSWDRFKQVLKLKKKIFRQKPVRKDQDEIDSVYDIIEEEISNIANTDGWADHSSVLTKSGFQAKRFNQIISTLIQQDKIEVELVQTGGRPLRRYKLK
jgi:hypothetical protein